jgi:chromosome segregation ATPase
MNFEDLENLRSPSVGTYNFTPKDSKACAGAMRALQEKLKDLESENIDLKDKLIVLESRSNNDREKWQTRLMEEVQLNKEKESLYSSKVHDQEEQIEKLQLRICTLEEQVKIKETQVKYAEKDSYRLMEQFKVDVESLNLQIELLQKALSEKSSESKSSGTIVDRLEREKNLITEELKQEKRISASLQSEVNFLRENHESQRTSLQKNLEALESELSKTNAELLTKVKELEIKNKSLREMNSNQNKQIEHLRKELSQLSKIGKKNEESKDLGKNKLNESSKRAPVKSNSRTSIRSKSPQKSLTKDKSLTEFKPRESEDEVRRMIEDSEKNLDKLNQRYKTLLNLSFKETSDLATVRRDMSKIADEIDSKSEELYDLKKKQQEFLRAKLLV